MSESRKDENMEATTGDLSRIAAEKQAAYAAKRGNWCGRGGSECAAAAQDGGDAAPSDVNPKQAAYAAKRRQHMQSYGVKAFH